MFDLAPFSSGGRFFRGNLHTHCTRSDGALPVDEVIERYRDAGYDFLSITDHFMERYGYPITDTRSFRSPGFTTILGAELHAPALENGERWHILANGLPLDFDSLRHGETGPDIAARAVEAGAFLSLAHPAWYGLSLDDALSIPLAHAVEVYNHGCAVETDRGDGWYILDRLAADRHRHSAIATDDAHFKTPDAFGGWVQVKAERLEPEALVEALKAGRFYASQGPEIVDVMIDDETIEVISSPTRSVAALGQGSASAYQVGDGLTRTRLPRERLLKSAYLRVVVTDHFGRRAWTNPTFEV
ncbi:MAG: PHP domain-containing protein [Geminicoccaceae bacterium]